MQNVVKHLAEHGNEEPGTPPERMNEESGTTSERKKE
jgi:hypothetical protein